MSDTPDWREAIQSDEPAKPATASDLVRMARQIDDRAWERSVLDGRIRDRLYELDPGLAKGLAGSPGEVWARVLGYVEAAIAANRALR